MEKNLRTDLAAEARDLWQRGKKGSLSGLAANREDRLGLPVETVEIRTKEAEVVLCKPAGRYVTIELDALFRREEDAFRRCSEVLAGELRTQLSLSPGDSVLVVGLGNPDITPDAVGPLAAAQILPTRHLRERLGADFASFRPVSVLRAGVLGTTGVESAELAAAVVERIHPARVIAIDALAARKTSRLCRAIQVSDSGIIPGSGVGNARSALNRETLGVPVVAVGVPTVVDAGTLCSDLGGGPAPEGAENMFVTPRDIDAQVRLTARVAGYGVNLALQDGLTVPDVDLLLS